MRPIFVPSAGVLHEPLFQGQGGKLKTHIVDTTGTSRLRKTGKGLPLRAGLIFIFIYFAMVDAVLWHATVSSYRLRDADYLSWPRCMGLALSTKPLG